MSIDTPDLTPEQVDALADADFREKVREELRRLRHDHREFQVALLRAEERLRQYNTLCDTLAEFADANSSDPAWDALRFVSEKAIAALDAVHEAEADLHHATVAISCLERNGFVAVPEALLVDDCPF